MEQKTLKIISSIFAFFLLLGVASALSITSAPTVIEQSSGSFTITINNTDAQSGTVEVEDLIQGTEEVDFSVAGGNTLISGINDYTIDYVVSSGFDFDLGKTYSTTITAQGDSSSDSEVIEFRETTFCSGYENNGRLDVEIDEINVNWGYGDENDYWYLMDEIEVEVIVTNDGNWDIENIELEWELYTEDGVLIMDDSENDFDLKDDDDTTIVFSFILDEDIDEFDGNDAVLYVRAIGSIDDSDSQYDGDDTCAYEKTSQIEVVTDDDFVIVDDLEINSFELGTEQRYENVLACGTEVKVTGSLWNIGEDDQDDVALEIYSNQLDVYERIEFDEVESFESEDFSYTFEIPSELDEDTYTLQFEVYDEDNDLFENSEDDESIRYVYLDIAGNCRVIAPGISASLVEESVVSGESMTITTTVTNNNDRTTIYTLAASNFEDWAKLNSISPEVVSLSAGETKEVELSFSVKEDMSGSRDFNIDVYSNGEVVSTQPISVNVEEGSFGLGKVLDRETLQIIGIVLLNLILIVAIIIVARKIVKKRK